MSKGKHTRRSATPAIVALPAAVALLLFLCTPSALAGPPTHVPLPGLDINGFNHACGTAVDSEGDVYVSSAGESKVRVFDPAHTELASIPNSNQPCGLATDSTGALYVSEQATGKVVRYKPNAYPLSGAPTYGAAEPIDSSGEAKGIAVDPADDRLYVAEGDRVSVYKSDGTPSVISEVQTVNVFQATGGTYTLSFQGQETGPIAYNASPAEVEAALTALPTIGAGNVEVKRPTFEYVVTFTGALDGLDVEALKADASSLVGGEGKGVSIAEQTKGFNGHFGEGALSEATAVVVYTYASRFGDAEHYVFVADSSSDEVEVITGAAINSLKPSFTIDGKAVPDSASCPSCSDGFGFGAAGAALALDWSNGHVFVYDDAHGVLDEFDASGEYLDQTASPSFSDAAPTGVAVLPERSATQDFSSLSGSSLSFEGAQTAPLPSPPSAAQVQAALEALPTIGAGNVSVRFRELSLENRYLITFTGDLANRHLGKITGGGTENTPRLVGYGPGRVYVTAGEGAGAKLLAFGPLAAPGRAALPELSHQLANAGAVAIDSAGDVYVLAGALIHVYDPSGKEIAVGPAGNGIDDPNNPLRLSVDSTGHVYVIDKFKLPNPEGKVTYYTPNQYPPVDGTTYARHEPPVAGLGSESSPFAAGIAVNPSNDHLLVMTSTWEVSELDSAANGSAFIRDFAPTLNFAPHSTIGVYGANGDVYIGEPNSGNIGISVVNAAGTQRLARISGVGSPGGLFAAGKQQFAVDQSNGHLLSFQNQLGAAREYDASGAFVAEFAFPEPLGFSENNVVRPSDIAIDNSGGPSDGNVYVAFDDPKKNTPDLWAFGPLAYGETPLALTGIADGLGGGSATLRGTVNPRGFDLLECKFEYLTDAEYVSNGEAFAGAVSTPCAEAAIGKGSVPVAVHAVVGGLDPEARYRFRLVASNKYGPSEGKAGLFGPPLIVAKSALPILYEEATLRAEVNPSGLATKYRFEYGTSESYGQSTPVAELPAGEDPIAIGTDVTGLVEGAPYHFRIVAENGALTVAGPDRTFVTLARRPVETCPNPEFRTGLSAKLPDCRAYELVTPAETNGLKPIAANSSSSGFNNWLVTPRGAGAGERVSYFTSRTLPGFNGNGSLDGYRATRGPGSHPVAGWTSELVGPTYPQSAPSFFSNLIQQSVSSDQLYSFWRIDPTETFPETLEAGIYLRTPSGFEPVGQGTLGTDLGAASRFVSPGGDHVIFVSKAQLEETAPPAGTVAVYDRAAGQASAHVVSLLPGEVALAAGQNAEYVASTEDGSTVLFRVGGALYLRRDNAETIQIAAAPNSFAGISEDGGRVYFMDATFGNVPTPAGLFMCEAQAGSCAGPEKTQEPTEVAPESIFVNVSPDGSHAFVTSEEALTGAEENEAGEVAEAGEHNLYAWDAGAEAIGFVSQLDPQDFVGFDGDTQMTLDAWARAVSPGENLGRAASPVRSTPDGRVLVFQSHAKLTGYDNEGEGEIYRYQPAASSGGELTCVSCDPGGAPPSADAMLTVTSIGVGRTTVVTNVTDDGQEVFFQSPDRLLPEDANAVQDVYEWKAKGAAGCGRDGGCLALISSGQGERGSHVYSMSADGHDVFFGTQEKLVGQDLAGSPSIYDARVDGGIPFAPEKAPCQGDACQGDGSIPPVISSPASTTIRSQGNAGGEEASSRCAKGQRKVRRNGKARCVAKHHKTKRHHKRRRSNHNRRAQR